jgi:hypothetical protein
MEADLICRVENVLPDTCVGNTSVTNALMRMPSNVNTAAFFPPL